MRNHPHLAFIAISLGLLSLCGCDPKDDDAPAAESDTATVEPSGDDTAESDGTPPPDETGEPDPSQYQIWSGPELTFTKENRADHTDPANQDTITERVILTRANRGSLFNVVLETEAGSASPAGAAWSFGTTADIASLTFEPLKTAADNVMQDVVGENMVLHLTEEDVYLDVTFVTWAPGGSNGGFSYTRSTEQ